MKKFKGLYIGYVLGAGILWGFTGLFVRCFSEWGLSSMQVVICRSATTAALLSAYFVFTDRSKFRIHLRDIGLFMLMGLCSVTVFNGCYFNAILQLQSMSVASVLLYTSPVFVTILSAIFFHEKITGLKWIAVALNFTGCFFTSGILQDSIHLSAIGIVLGISAGLAYALYSIFGKLALSRSYHPLTIVFYMWLFGFLFSVPFGQVGGLVENMRQRPSEIGMYFLFGMISAVLPYALYTIGLQHVPAATAGILASTEPCIASLVGVCLFSEPLTTSLCIGVLGVVVSVVLINYTDIRERCI